MHHLICVKCGRDLLQHVYSIFYIHLHECRSRDPACTRDTRTRTLHAPGTARTQHTTAGWVRATGFRATGVHTTGAQQGSERISATSGSVQPDTQGTRTRSSARPAAGRRANECARTRPSRSASLPPLSAAGERGRRGGSSDADREGHATRRTRITAERGRRTRRRRPRWRRAQRTRRWWAQRLRTRRGWP